MKNLKKNKIVRISLLTLFSVLLCVSVFFAVGRVDNVFAAWTNDGGVDHYTDMSSNGDDLEYYDTLYNYNWFTCSGLDIANHKNNESGKIKGKLSGNWTLADDTLLRFYPSTNNTTASFVWKFKYTPTVVAASGMNIYPLSATNWKGSTQIDIAPYFTEAGKTYKVELGVVKVKNNTQYYVFLKVDDVFKIGTYRTRAIVGDYGADTDYTGLYFYITAGAGTVSVPDDYESTYLEDYITVQNADLGAPTSFSDKGYAGQYNVPTVYSTTSMVYKFYYGAGDATYITIRDNGARWKGYTLITNGRILQFYLDAEYQTQYTLYNIIPGDVDLAKYLVEFGAIDIKNSDNLILFVKINGDYKLYEIAEKRADYTDGSTAQHGYGQDSLCCVGTWSGGTAGTLSQVDNTSDVYEVYDELYNCDWSATCVGETTIMPDEWTPTKGTDPVISFTPSTENATASFVWKFTYIPTTIGDNLNLFPLSAKGWDSSLTNPIVYGSYFTEAGKEYSVEFGVKKLQNSDNYHIYLNVDGTRKVSLISTRKGDSYTKMMVYPNNGEGTFNAEKYKYEINLKDGTSVVRETLVDVGSTPDAYDGSALTTDGNVFVGYQYNGELYQTFAEAVSARSAGKLLIIAKTIYLNFDGAGLKLYNENADATIRFTSSIKRFDVTEVEDYGVIFTTAEIVGSGEFTHSALSSATYFYDLHKNNDGTLSVTENGDYYTYYVYLSSISLANYGVEFSARPYVKVTYSGKTESSYVYAPYSNDDSRSVYSVAKKAIDGGKETAETMAICQKYINGVIELDSNYSLVGVTNETYQRNYTVAVSDEDTNGFRTITLTSDGSFDLKLVGSIYVGGKKMTVTGASLAEDKKSGTFKVAVTDDAEDSLKKNEIVSNFESDISAYNADASLELLAYDGPQFGIKYDSSETNGWIYYADAAATVATLKEYADAGFNVWYCSDATWGNNFRYVTNEKTCLGTFSDDSFNNTNYKSRDVFWALDLAAEYANTYGVAMPVYVVIDDVIALNSDNLDAIGTAYDVLTSYCDVYNGKNSLLGKTSQLAGFILKDEPTYDEYTKFAKIFNYLAYTKGAIEAGYTFEVALLQEYADSAYIGSNGYQAYLDLYAPLFKDTAISYDNYPFSYTSSTNTYSMGYNYFQNMEKVRAKEAAVYGTCIQSYVAGASTSSYKAITMESEISLQVYSSLAYGFTRLSYFNYWQRGNDANQTSSEVFQNNMIRWNDYSDWTKGYKTTDLYTWAKDTNEKALNLSKILLRFNSVGVQPIYSSVKGGQYFNESTKTNTTNAIEVTSTYNLLVGGFQNEKYNGYLAVAASAPHDGNPDANATFNFGSGYNFAIVYTMNGEKEVYELSDGKLTLSIATGDAAFIVPIV